MILSVFKSAVCFCQVLLQAEDAIAIKSCAEQVLRGMFVSYILAANLILSGMANKYENAVLGFLILPSSFHLLSRCKW